MGTVDERVTPRTEAGRRLLNKTLGLRTSPEEVAAIEAEAVAAREADLAAALEVLHRLRLNGAQLDDLNLPDKDADEFAVDWDEYDEFLRLDDVLRLIRGEAGTE